MDDLCSLTLSYATGEHESMTVGREVGERVVADFLAERPVLVIPLIGPAVVYAKTSAVLSLAIGEAEDDE